MSQEDLARDRERLWQIIHCVYCYDFPNQEKLVNAEWIRNDALNHYKTNPKFQKVCRDLDAIFEQNL